MNANDNINKYSYNEMQELMPDYIFDRINDDARECFEASLPDYPDLQDEIMQVSEVFRKVEAIDFNKIMEKHSRNISTKVQKTLAYKKERRKMLFGVDSRLFAPALGILLIGLLVLSNIELVRNINKPKAIVHTVKKIDNNYNKNIFKISSAEASIVLSGIKKNKTLAFLSNGVTNGIIDETSINSSFIDENTINDIYEHTIIKSVIKNKQGKSAVMQSSNSIYDSYPEQLDNLDEKDFQKILSKLKHDKII